CHSVLGEGGRTAPDLARAPGGHLSSAEMLAAMWNHAPAMWEKMRVEGVPPPNFSEAEMANLFAFLYSVRSLDEPGDPDRGKLLLSQKKCLECHSVGGQGGRIGPDLKTWTSYRNPVAWIQAMWNHAPAMQRALAARGVAWPQFAGNDVADLIAYIRTLAPNPKARVYVRAADPESGRRLFEQKGCVKCHAIAGHGSSRAPNLGTHELPRTLGQFAGEMWNHAPIMRASMQAQQVSRPEFSNKEMADLISYLFAQRYFEVSGNAARGRRVYTEKGCDSCHTLGSGSGRGPDLTHSGAAPISIATALWNHGPMMLQTMHQQQVVWPRFQPGEIVDLLEFLNRARTAPVQAGVKR
ncbi:MAG TPA: c-type cytochrome, partial [Terriglobales bacterium]|nr:c-type cytochrome [Terriglobales bacterium]